MQGIYEDLKAKKKELQSSPTCKLKTRGIRGYKLGDVKKEMAGSPVSSVPTHGRFYRDYQLLG